MEAMVSDHENDVKEFQKEAESAKDADVKKMFDSLAKMETSHKARLEDIYTNQAFPEAW